MEKYKTPPYNSNMFPYFLSKSCQVCVVYHVCPAELLEILAKGDLVQSN